MTSRWIERGERVVMLLQGRRRAAATVLYAAVAAGSLLAAFLLRFEFRVPSEYSATIPVAVAVAVAARLVFSRFFRLTTGRWRFVGTGDMVRLFFATSAATGVLLLAFEVLPLNPSVPRSVLAMDWALNLLGVAGLWLGYREAFERMRFARSDGTGEARPVLVVGAGEAGNLLAREILRMPTGYRLVGFVDDDPLRWGATLHGVEVIGGTMDLTAIAEHVRAEEIIIAVPSATPGQLRSIVARCEESDVPFKVLPGIQEVLEGNVSLGHLRELRIEDLLGREPVKLELPELAEDLGGARVLVTGGAGSIGSELARQVAIHRPSRLIVLDQAESDLYFLELELRERHPDLDLVPIVGDVLDNGSLEEVFRTHQPCRVFHAAAYKHVPVMESNIREAVRNNVIGTWRVARAAARHGSEKFVLISTDKAVEPSSVMGATKRVGELVTMACERRYERTSYVAVRFGNVLGSNGSVIPLFQKQLREGGVLTVTHAEATRYFMTIAEAAQLVLQASVLPDAQGRIAMLDMGEPVKIVDLARNLVRLSGARLDADAKIEFTGLRPGEKLHETLASGDEVTTATRVEKVRIVESAEGCGEEVEVWERMQELVRGFGEAEEEQLRGFLARMVRPARGIVERSGTLTGT